jgi:phosphoserine phosphatase
MTSQYDYEVIFIDVCGTLVDQNTTHSLLANLGVKSFEANLYLSFVGRIIGKIVNALFGDDIYRKFLIYRLLRNRSELEVAECSANVAQKLKYKTEFIRDIHEMHPNASKILLSASLSPIVKQICKNMNFNGFYATDLKLKDGFYTGHISNDLLGKKHKVLRKYKEKITIFYTDNDEDLECDKFVTSLIKVEHT